MIFSNLSPQVVDALGNLLVALLILANTVVGMIILNLKVKRDAAKVAIGQDRWDLLKRIIGDAALAAEKLGATKAIDDKLTYALENAAAAAEARGIKTNAEELRMLIEAYLQDYIADKPASPSN